MLGLWSSGLYGQPKDLTMVPGRASTALYLLGLGREGDWLGGDGAVPLFRCLTVVTFSNGMGIEEDMCREDMAKAGLSTCGDLPLQQRGESSRRS